MQEGMFPCPRGQKTSSKQGRARESSQRQGKLWSLTPPLSRKQREGNESSILSHWHLSLKRADWGAQPSAGSSRSQRRGGVTQGSRMILPGEP